MLHGTVEIAAGLLHAADGHAWLSRVLGPLTDFSNMVFFQQINEFLRDEIDEFGVNLLGRMMAWVGSVVLALMTLWISLQGYRIVTGHSRDSMMSLVANSLRSVLVIGLATGMAIGGSSIYRFLGDDVSRQITHAVTGNDEDAYASIDRSLGYMQYALSSIDMIQAGNDEAVDDAKTRAMWFTGIGTGGPAITAGTMLLLNKIAMALFIGFGPLFILSLLFEQTKPLFGKWLYYGIGTMFSLAVLSVMVGLALDMVTAVAASFWVGHFVGASQEGINSMALQQGGLGLILTMLIISAPPMAASFFQGMLGNFTPYAAFGANAGDQRAQSNFGGHGVAGSNPYAARMQGRDSNANVPLHSGTQGIRTPILHTDSIRSGTSAQQAAQAYSVVSSGQGSGR
jgi:type IV secretion system protein VirB6